MPFISVVVPCRNEARYIKRCLESILAGDYPSERLEVIVADGLSEDGTRRIIEEMQAREPRLRLVDNPKRTTPAALNRAIETAKGEIIIRMDAHALIAPDYARRCVEALSASGADNVGGIMQTIPAEQGSLARALAAAISHPFGVGNSRFRTHSTAPIWVDTVFGGCYRRDVFDRVGFFNENLARGQDMEFNLRLRRAGGKILLDPAIVSWYFSLSDMSSFLAHNWTNGVWAIMPFAWSEGAPVTIRHLVPMIFSGVLLIALALAPDLFLAILALYSVSALAASFHCAASRRDMTLLPSLPICFAALHLPYGFGSLWGAGTIAVMKAREGALGKRLFDAVAAGPSAVSAKISLSFMAKRLFDVMCSFVGLVVCSPLLIVAAIAIKWGSRGPLFYRGARVGMHGKPFRILKFRTMVVNAEKIGGPSTSADDPRVTPIGSLLRQYKLDELPQLLNVLAGDMSLVGPRPEVPSEVAGYDENTKRLLLVRPGITDYSSIRFRNEGEILRGHADPHKAYKELIQPEKIRLGLKYVDEHSLWLDIKLIFMTLGSLAR